MQLRWSSKLWYTVIEAGMKYSSSFLNTPWNLGAFRTIFLDRFMCSTACGTAHIRLHFREAEMQHPLRISARGNAQLSVHFLKRGQEKI